MRPSFATSLSWPLAGESTSTRPNTANATALGLPGGLLVYAQGEADTASYTVRRCGTRLEVAALELAGTLEEILEAVRHIAKKIVRLRDEAGGTRMGNRLFVTDPRRHFG